VEQFLRDTSTQLTDLGLIKLHEVIKEGEMVVFFRNNHFSTLTKHKSQLFNLVTDIGYERERNLMWEGLSAVRGDTTYYSDEFESTGDVKRREIISTALQFGFPEDKIHEAIKILAKPHEELKVDDLLQYLNKHFTPNFLS